MKIIHQALLYLNLKNLDFLDPLQEANKFGTGFS